MIVSTETIHAPRLLSVLEPDARELSDRMQVVATYSRISAGADALLIASGQGEISVAARVEQPGVLFLRTAVLREILVSFKGRAMPLTLRFEHPNLLHFGHRQERLLPGQFRHYAKVSEAALEPPLDLDRDIW